MKAEDLMAKAIQAAASAKVLLDACDADGAANRAYYAMFDAARAALLASGHDVGKTHKGVLNAFSDRLVKNGPLPKELGRLLKRAETFRYVADYEGALVELDDAREMVAQAETFVAAMRTGFMPDESLGSACATPST
jgi:uncharacterized protein (UPF0332 family)